MTAKEWTRGAIRAHLGATFQTFHRLRSELLAATNPEEGEADADAFGAALREMSAALTAESAWLTSLQPVPEALRTSSRTAYLALYARHIVALGESMTKAVTPPFDTKRYEDFGIQLLSFLTLERRMKDVR